MRTGERFNIRNFVFVLLHFSIKFLLQILSHSLSQNHLEDKHDLETPTLCELIMFVGTENYIHSSQYLFFLTTTTLNSWRCSWKDVSISIGRVSGYDSYTSSAQHSKKDKHMSILKLIGGEGYLNIPSSCLSWTCWSCQACSAFCETRY